jgi:hypothetical protein
VWSKQLGPQPLLIRHRTSSPVDPLDADESLGSTETCDWRTSGLTLGCAYSEPRVALSEGGVTFRFHFVFPSRKPTVKDNS